MRLSDASCTPIGYVYVYPPAPELKLRLRAAKDRAREEQDRRRRAERGRSRSVSVGREGSASEAQHTIVTLQSKVSGSVCARVWTCVSAWVL